MKICTFLWVYYGYPSSSYEGVSVEKMRYHCGRLLARRDDVRPDIVAGVPDSGTAARHRLRQRVRHPLLPPVHQIYPHLAALLHAHHPEQAQPDRQDEADSRARPDPGQAACCSSTTLLSAARSCAKPPNSSTRAAPRRFTCAPPARPCCTAAST